MIDLNKLVKQNILALQPYSSARDEFSGEEGVFLDANENPFGELNRYPDPYQRKLKQKLAQLKNVSVGNTFIGNGSDEVIDLAFRIFCDPAHDKALTFTPTYGMYEVAAGINNVELLKIPLDTEFQIDLAGVKQMLQNNNIKLMFICSPNNPTANLINKADIEYLLSNFNGIIFIDEAYIDFADNENSSIGLINRYNNLIVSQTLSKAWGLAGARIGTAYASDEIIKLYNKVKPPYNVSKMNQQAAINALDNIEVFKKNLSVILSEKERLKRELSKTKLVRKIYRSDANFLLVEVSDADFVYNELVKQKIIVRNRNKQVKNCIRISVGTPQENDELLTALNNLQ